MTLRNVLVPGDLVVHEDEVEKQTTPSTGRNPHFWAYY